MTCFMSALTKVKGIEPKNDDDVNFCVMGKYKYICISKDMGCNISIYKTHGTMSFKVCEFQHRDSRSFYCPIKIVDFLSDGRKSLYYIDSLGIFRIDTQDQYAVKTIHKNANYKNAKALINGNFIHCIVYSGILNGSWALMVYKIYCAEEAGCLHGDNCDCKEYEINVCPFAEIVECNKDVYLIESRAISKVVNEGGKIYAKKLSILALKYGKKIVTCCVPEWKKMYFANKHCNTNIIVMCEIEKQTCRHVNFRGQKIISSINRIGNDIYISYINSLVSDNVNNDYTIEVRDKDLNIIKEEKILGNTKLQNKGDNMWIDRHIFVYFNPETKISKEVALDSKINYFVGKKNIVQIVTEKTIYFGEIINAKRYYILNEENITQQNKDTNKMNMVAIAICMISETKFFGNNDFDLKNEIFSYFGMNKKLMYQRPT